MRTVSSLRVFVSYSWDSEDHKEKVKTFILNLRAKGFAVIYDGDLEPGDRLQGFMECAIANSDIILYICTPNYKYRADNRISGVGYENNIITAELFESHNERKFIPILFTGTWEDSLPIWSKGKLGIDLSKSSVRTSEYMRLLKTLKNLDKHESSYANSISTNHRRSKERERKRKKKLQKCFAGIIFLFCILFFFSGIQIYKSVRKRRMKNAYMEFLFSSAEYQKEVYNVNYINFTFGYINNDDIPELFLGQGSSHADGIFVYSYDYEQDKVYCLGELSSFGTLDYYEKQNMIVSQYGGMGRWYHTYEQIQEDGELHIIAISGSDGGNVEKIRYYWAYPYLQSDEEIFEDIKYRLSEEKYNERKVEFLSEYDNVISIAYKDMIELTKENVNTILDRTLK